MKKKVFYIMSMLMAVSLSTHAQSLSVQDIEAQTGEETQLVVSLAEGTSMTALQFNLSLPEGVSLKENSGTYGTTLGEATDGHTLSVQPLASGDLLVILYSMEQKAFRNGELLRIPLKAGSTAASANGKLYTIRTATASAVSHPCANVSFSAKVTEPVQPVTVTANSQSMVYGDNVPSLTYKTSGATLSGTPKLSTTATKTSAVGTYTIKVEKGTVTNASVTYVDGTLTITKAPLTITAKSYTIKQGEALPTFAATYSGFKNSETESVLSKKPIFSCTATSSSAPGTYDITVSGAEAGNYNISYAKGTLTIEKKDEPEPSYKVGDDITSLATAEWEGRTADYGGLANPAVERYTHAAPDVIGDILTQTVTDLRNGTYKVQLDVAASFTSDRGFECPTGNGLSVAFANGTQRNLAVVDRGWVGEGEQKTVTLTATVTDGTLKYGIKNLAPSGNWFVARLKSIVYVSESSQSPKTYAVSINSDKNGTTVTDVDADEEGSRVFITATPNEGCTLESIKVTTTGGQEVEVANNSFIMPASAVKVTATYKNPQDPNAIENVNANESEYQICTLDGKQVETLQKGVNIIRYSDGTTKKVYVK